MLKNLRRLTVKDDPPLAEDEDEGARIYSQSKIIGEQMAKEIVENSTKSIICARFGWVNPENQPGTTWERSVWLSHQDLCSFMEKVIQAPSHISGPYFAMSNNHRLWVDIDDTKTDLGYIPQDGAQPLE